MGTAPATGPRRVHAYTDRRDGHYATSVAVTARVAIGTTYVRAMDALFDTYSELREPLARHLDETLRRSPTRRRKRDPGALRST